MIKSNNPNIYFADKIVRLVLAMWDFQEIFETKVGGNTKGLNVLKAAVDNIWDNFTEKGKLVLPNEDGNVLVLISSEVDRERFDNLVIYVELVNEEKK